MSSLGNLLALYNLIKIDYNSEIWLKSQKVKIKMLKVLINNIKTMLNIAEIPFHKYQLSSDSARIFFFFKNEHISNALKILRNIFGIQTMSPALRTSNKLEHIKTRCLEVAEEILEHGDTFAIRAKRSGIQEYSSQDIAKLMGQAVMDKFSKKLNIRVNLTNPIKTIFIEVRDQFAYIFSEILKTTWKGLPTELHKKILVSDIGRLDDFLAGFLLSKRGAIIHPVLFNLTKNPKNWKVRVNNWNTLLNYIPFKQFKVLRIELSEEIEKIYNNSKSKRYTCALCRLIRFRILSKINLNDELSDKKGIKAITDGINFNNRNFCSDRIDLKSLSLNSYFTRYPIFTPNIGFDSEIIQNLIFNISKNLKDIDFCDLKPINQEFNRNQVAELFHSMKLEPFLTNLIQDSKKIIIKNNYQ